jgi:hypothetical protein
MNYEIACRYLDLNQNDEITKELLKRQYKLKALCYHPDKNKDPGATEQFLKIQESYEFLLKDLIYCETGSDDDCFKDGINEDDDDIDNSDIMSNYNKILFSFIGRFLGDDMNPLVKLILQKITGKCEEKAIEFMSRLDKQLLIKINGILKIYKDAFHLSAHFFDKIDELCSEKMKHDECIILNPGLNDLYDNMLYRLQLNNSEYVVPLWHHELMYDNSGTDIYVRCYPILPENISIDHQNNIHVQLKYKIADVWGVNAMQVSVCDKKVVSFFTKDLRLVKKQTIVLPKEGISRINTSDIFDITKMSDVILHIELEQ